MDEKQSMGVNYAADNFRQELVTQINNSGLPVCIVRMIFSEMAGQLYQMEQKQVKQERADYQNKQPAEAE